MPAKEYEYEPAPVTHRTMLKCGPPGAQAYQEGLYYKVVCGRLFRHDGFEWVLARRPIHSVTFPQSDQEAA